MRQFKITILWQNTGHTDIFIHVFHPSHTKPMTADGFLSMMNACVSKSIDSCTTEAQNYIVDYFLDSSQVAQISSGIVQSVEEIDA